MSSIKKPTEAFRASRLFEDGIGHVVISRFKSNGDVEAGVFRVDVFCLGVKDAFFTRLSQGEYESRLLAKIFTDNASKSVEPCCARKLVEDAVQYARQLGIDPHRDYKAACRVFGGISAEDCADTFQFGKDGKPLFISGPDDSEARCKLILNTLQRHCGEGKFDYLVGVPEEEERVQRLPKPSGFSLFRKRTKSGFDPIALKDYVPLHRMANPDTTEAEIVEEIQSALAAAQRGERCECGNPIWVVGAAWAGLGCYTCITGEPHPKSEYEIDEACPLHETNS